MRRFRVLNVLKIVLTLCTLFISTAFAQEKKAAEKWDITEPFGPTTRISFETSEGTWMNVDVSPDGKTIVFDLLGDIYTIPITGGEATRITSGPAFDIQPRFSPDGTTMAYISDRGGNNNVWVMDADGRNARQVSSEAEREVSSPAWSPDGEYIYVRKHFVERRSLGAGEVWMYHVSGSGGLQVTKRNGWQKDQGEPAISTDGKYLYYSRNVTSGQTFQYNKDPNGIIYAILRRDLVTGKERRIASRPGGSITPRPSPDGRLLAFVRRVRLKTELFLHDLETGQEWPIFDKLDRDMQEAWAVQGVYTQYAWTPDGTSIVIWGQGRIWKVDAQTGTYEEIPFTAKVDQTIHEALRFKPDISSDDFQVKMLRDVTTSPDGKSVAYSAMGHIYIKTLPNGAPRRLTGEDRLEYDPSFSPDGKSIVYTTWTDADGGRVRVVGVVGTDGRNGRDVVTARGHYTEASFSPGGEWIVYRSVSGDRIRGRTFAEHVGIYRVRADGSETPELVTRNGSSPLFDHTGKRIYVRRRSDGKIQFVSVDLEGEKPIVYFESTNATRIVPSPDGKWVAFAERYRAYIAAFPHTGRTISLGPEAKGLPVARVSDNAGTYLHWSGDSQRLHWSLGPKYFTRDLTETFPFVAGGREKPAEPETAGIEIGFTARSDRPSGTVAFVGARIITSAPNGPDVIENGTIVVSRNRITAVGAADQVTVPAGAFRVDAQGKTIMPGIIDAHAHVGGEGNGILAQASWPLMANLAFGVTTSHDPSNNTTTVFTNSEMIRAGMKLGPRLFSTGTILYGAEGNFKAIVNNYDDALKHLERMKAVGAFSVKSYNQRRRDARQMILKAARKTQMMVVPEGGSLVYFNESMVIDGHTGVEHSLPVPVVYRDIAQLFGRSRSGYTPTMIVGYGGLSGEYYWYERTNVWENKRLLTFTPRDVVDPRSRRRLKAAGDDDFNHVLISRGVKAIQDAGGLVQLGAHGQLQGLGAHWELWMFAQGGMTPLEAIRAATINGATYLGLDEQIGSIEQGKLADLVVMSDNPLDDIRNTESIEMVMINGRLYDAATLNQIGNHPAERLRLYWELEQRGVMQP